MSATAAKGSLVGVDIGATKTRVRVEKSGVAVADEVVATSSWRTVSSEKNVRELLAEIAELAGGLDGSVRLGIGAHGCDSTKQCLAFESALAAEFPGPVRVLNDAELLPLAMGITGGIGIVSGTGSICVARDGAGQLVRAGGWGWVLGDEGGATGIVREAVRASLASLDAGEPPDALVSRLFSCFGAADGPELAMAFTRSSSAAYWGSHAAEVFEAAEEGSVLAARVIDAQARALAHLVDNLPARGVTADRVVAGGGVIRTQPRLRDAFLAEMGRSHPHMTATVVDREPVEGALALARSLQDREGKT